MPVRRPLPLLFAALLLAAALAVAASAESPDAAVPGPVISVGDGTRYERVDGGMTPPPKPTPPTRSRRSIAGGPVIASVFPPIASAGTNTTITIAGTGFGTKTSRTSPADVGFPSAGGVYWASGRTNDVNPNEILSWSDTEIVVRVPSGRGASGIRETASSGGLRVVTDAGQESQPFPFAVSFGVADKRWAAPPVFVVNDNCPGVANGAEAVRRAVASWNTALPADFRIDCSGSTNRTEPAKDGRSVIAWGPSGYITFHYENSTIVEADIILSTSYAWTTGEGGGSVYSIEAATLRNLAFCLGIAWLAGTEPQGPTDAFKAGSQYRTDALGNMNLVALSGADRAAAAYLYGGGSANAPLLAAAFGADTIAGPAPLAVRFSDAALGGATGRSWDFGDGETSTERDPAHIYAAPGNYTVELTASAPGYPDDAIRAVRRIAVAAPAVAAVPGGAGIPTDTDGDGRYDDVNGNGRKDFADVVLYFDRLNWIAGNEPIAYFDYNDNGRIDFADVVQLFDSL